MTASATSTPTVSVIVPNYNHAPFLEQRINSILAQREVDFELILLDDASTDDSLTILRPYASRPGTQLITNTANSGSPFAQWNRGVDAARGRYVWIAESDDVAAPDFLAQLTAILDRHPSAALAYCASQRITADGKPTGLIQHDRFADQHAHWQSPFCRSGRDEIREFLFFQNTIPSASAVLFRRDAYRRAGAADPSFRIAGDWLQWMRLIAPEDVAYLPEPLSQSRIHAASQRAATASNGRLESETLRVQQRIAEALSLPRELRTTAAGQQATSWLQHLRAGRFTGHTRDHARFLGQLAAAAPRVAARFLLQFPYAWTAGSVKRRFAPATADRQATAEGNR